MEPNMSTHPPRIKPGERVIVAGRTGSGKSTLATFLLRRSRQHWIVFNPKHTSAYNKLPNAKILSGFKASRVQKSLMENQFTILNFNSREADPDFMDDIITWLHENYKNIGLCADELYTLHNNGRPGPGLVSWETRGRELGQSFLGLTQRPAWVSKFVFSEASYIGCMDLNLPEDRKKMRDNTGFEGFLDRLAPHYWRWYNVEADTATLFKPVPLPSQTSEET
jgi:energy-coupling factor transporter ATP-binding protein EcfA2